MKLLFFEIKIIEVERVESKYLFRLVTFCFISRRCCFHFSLAPVFFFFILSTKMYSFFLLFSRFFLKQNYLPNYHDKFFGFTQ